MHRLHTRHLGSLVTHGRTIILVLCQYFGLVNSQSDFDIFSFVFEKWQFDGGQWIAVQIIICSWSLTWRLRSIKRKRISQEGKVIPRLLIRNKWEISEIWLTNSHVHLWSRLNGRRPNGFSALSVNDGILDHRRNLRHSPPPGSLFPHDLLLTFLLFRMSLSRSNLLSTWSSNYKVIRSLDHVVPSQSASLLLLVLLIGLLTGLTGAASAQSSKNRGQHHNNLVQYQHTIADYTSVGGHHIQTEEGKI